MKVFEVLADPVRMQIVELLAEGERTAGEIAARFSISRPAISRHLRVLRESGLARVRGDAQHRVYRLNTEPLREAGAWIALQSRRWETRLDLLGSHLDEMARERTGLKEDTA
ncbi:MAG: metalloregulator ArsR/SmtB family transcription factor [Chloroflexi bacterium]|nr:metalloregulator ArsR/SmtB family transcription factor [Chloroflexota bacterium]